MIEKFLISNLNAIQIVLSICRACEVVRQTAFFIFDLLYQSEARNYWQTISFTELFTPFKILTYMLWLKSEARMNFIVNYRVFFLVSTLFIMDIFIDRCEH